MYKNYFEEIMKQLFKYINYVSFLQESEILYKIYLSVGENFGGVGSTVIAEQDGH